MGNDIQIKIDIDQIRSDNPWFDQFKLSDSSIDTVSLLYNRVLLGSDALDQFYDKISKSLKIDKSILNKLLLEIVYNKFWLARKRINGLDEFIKKLGGKLPTQESNEVAEKETTIKREAKLENDTAKMVFSSTDEEEIKALPKMEHNGPSADDYVAQAQAIIKELGFKEKDEIVVKRLQNFIIGKLRNVRDDIELMEVLTKSRKIGGMELEEGKARFLVKLINDKEKDFHNGIVPELEPESEVRPKIEFPVYQEPMAKKKSASVNTTADETFKPLTLQEKREKDGFAQPSSNQANDVASDVKDNSDIKKNFNVVAKSNQDVSKTPPILPPAYRGTGSERGGKNAVTSAFPPKEEVEDLPIDSQDLGKKDFGGLPPKEDVYPIIEEEDGLPVIRMPQEMMTKPKVLPPRSLAPIKPVSSVKTGEVIPAAVIDKPIDNIIIEPAKQEVITARAEAPVFKKPANLPPPKPAPYITSAKSLPPKTTTFAAKRPSLDDVKFVRKLVGPVEELETMTIIDFRRLDSDPKVAVKKIKEKIILLEKELYQKRAEGIAAWHKSEVSRFYRLLGQASMAEGRSIEEIIAERRQASKPTLTIEEFNAIMELNRELRY